MTQHLTVKTLSKPIEQNKEKMRDKKKPTTTYSCHQDRQRPDKGRETKTDSANMNSKAAGQENEIHEIKLRALIRLTRKTYLYNKLLKPRENHAAKV